SIDELILAYWQFAKAHYLKSGAPTGEIDAIRTALRPIRHLYGSTPAADFGPKKLKVVRHKMVEAGLSRGVVNDRVGRIKRMFKWAVAEELVPPSVYHGLQAVAGLAFGRSTARETEPVRPVSDLYVALILPFVSPVVAAMLKVQRLSGMRTGELVLMRPCDIDTSGEIWIYEPSDHKGRWRGHRKQIPLGPEAQQVLQPFLDRAPQAFLFSPQESEAWRLEHRPPYHGRARKTPIYPCELKRRQQAKEARRKQRKPKRPKRDRYDTNSYRRADKLWVCEGEEGRLPGAALAPASTAAHPRHRGPAAVRHRGRPGGLGARPGRRYGGLRRAEHGPGDAGRHGDGVTIRATPAQDCR
ncbi:MAG: hypothetical protein ABSF26_19845, partial [Thermoguttaceae bacterium]